METRPSQQPIVSLKYTPTAIPQERAIQWQIVGTVQIFVVVGIKRPKCLIQVIQCLKKSSSKPISTNPCTLMCQNPWTNPGYNICEWENPGLVHPVKTPQNCQVFGHGVCVCGTEWSETNPRADDACGGPHSPIRVLEPYLTHTHPWRFCGFVSCSPPTSGNFECWPCVQSCTSSSIRHHTGTTMGTHTPFVGFVQRMDSTTTHPKLPFSV